MDIFEESELTGIETPEWIKKALQDAEEKISTIQKRISDCHAQKTELEEKFAQIIESRGHLEIYLQSIKVEREKLKEGLVDYFRDQLAEAR